jgi:peptidoglycan/xylan/chitin deacetylase (PgdA/CDA1 family)
MSAGRGLRAQAAPVAKTALLRLGGYAACRLLAPSDKIAILRYHAVCGPEGYAYADPAICISPAAFAAQARYLAANYSVLPLPEVVSRIRAQQKLPRNTVVITFDDGYADNLAAARTLHAHGLTGTFFITAGCLAGGDPFWPAEIRAQVAAIRQPVIDLQVSERVVQIPVDTAAARDKAVRTLTRLFKSHPIALREAMRTQLRELAGGARVPNCMLRVEDVVEMHRLGMTIGSHTLTHPNLPSAGAASARAELVASKARLEAAIGEPVTMFAYPNGGAERYETPEVRRIVAETGYAAAVTSFNGHATVDSDLYAIERVHVEERLEDLVFALEVERFAFKPQPRESNGVSR